MPKKKRPGGSVEEARKRVGLSHPLGHREYKAHPKRQLTEDKRPDPLPDSPTMRDLDRYAKEVEVVGPEIKGRAQDEPPETKRSPGPPKKRNRQSEIGRTRKDTDRPNYGIGQGVGSPGRQKGATNAMPRILKELIFTAMDMVGRDGRGKDKAAGYLARIAIRKPEIFGKFIEKMIPYTMTGPDGGPVQVQYEGKDAILTRMRERGMPVPKSLQGPGGALRVVDPEVTTVQEILQTPVREHVEENGGDPDDLSRDLETQDELVDVLEGAGYNVVDLNPTDADHDPDMDDEETSLTQGNGQGDLPDDEDEDDFTGFGDFDGDVQL